MKSIIRIALIILLITNYQSLITLNAQISINEDGSSPDASAMLDVSSTDKGILIPRMDSTSRNNISNPATGLMVFDTDNNSFWYYNGTAWTEIGAASFISENGITRSVNNDDDFVFGADSLNYGTGDEYKMFFDKSLGAFRAGIISDNDWDENSLGAPSIGLGNNVLASGNLSVAIGTLAEATESFTISIGTATKATGIYSTAMGYGSVSQGAFSTTLGLADTAYSYGETVLGIFSTSYTPNETLAFDNNDRLLVVGNGTGTSNRSDAMVIYKNGNTEINGDLTVSGSITGSNSAFISDNGFTYANNSDDFVFGADSLNYGGSGDEYKFFFDKSKGAFRAGTTNTTDWDESNIGYYSAAFGENNIASGIASFAVGGNNNVSGTYAAAFGNENDVTQYASIALGEENQVNGGYSVAFGEENTISSSHSYAFGYNQTLNSSFSVAFGGDNVVGGVYSFATGSNNTANGLYSFAAGSNNTVSGTYASALGSNNTANGLYTFAVGSNNTVSGTYASALGQNLETPSYGEVAIGFYNTTYTANSATSSDSDDRLFVIGNGTSSSRSDAMVVYKNGNTEINGSVGIGTTPTNADLEILSSGSNNSFSLSNIGYLNTSGAGVSSYTGRFSIYADGRISGVAFIAHSDKRIKNIIGQSNGQSDLEILNKIQITDYTMKDQIKHDNKVIKKVIAQQVKSVYPQAVNNNTTEIIPNIYQRATIDENGWVIFNDELRMINDDLKTDDKVQIIFEDKKELLEVLEIKENTFRVETLHCNVCTDSEIFVYGKQVNDFHTVDYEAISMLNVSATQELAKKVEILEKENQQLKTQLKKVNQLEATLQQLQAQLNNQNQ